MAVAESVATLPPAGDAIEESTPFKLFVGQVPMQMTAEQLKPNFEPFGNIEEVTIIYDKTTRVSKGCGFVTYSTEEAARAAIDALSEKCMLNGTKPLVVKFAEGLRQRMEHTLLVSHVPETMSEQEATELFAAHGEVKQLILHGRRPDDASPAGTATVRYSKRAEAVAAVAALHGHAGLPNAQQPLAVKFDEPAPGGNGNGNGVVPPPATAPPMQAQTTGGSGPMGAHAAPFAPGGGGGNVPPHDQGVKLFVGMIPYATSEGELHQLFSQFGALMEVFMMREKDGRSKGCAFVRFHTKEAANAACLALNGTLALPGAGRNLVVKYADASEPRNGRMGGGAGGPDHDRPSSPWPLSPWYLSSPVRATGV